MVEYIEVFGKQYPVRVGYYVMKKIKEKHGKSLGEALQAAQDDPSIHETILMAALQMGAYAEKQDLDLTDEDMPMVLDLVFPQYLKLFTSHKFFPKEVVDKTSKELDRLGKEDPGEGSPKRTTSPSKDNTP